MQRESIKKAIIVFLAFLTIFFTGGYAIANHYFNQLNIERQEIKHSIIATTKAAEATAVDKDNSAQNEQQPFETEAPSEPEFKGPKQKTILLIGTDRSGYLTDSMMVIRVDLKSKRVSIFSIPRDYRIKLTKDVQKAIGHYAKYIKLTEIHSYAKMAKHESPISLTTKAIEELTGLEFDHIVLIKLKAFKSVVDAVGGVEVYVPRNMNYDDPHQRLHIHLTRGYHLLDGAQAEGLVRFRKNNDLTGYGDFGRMEMQQYFLKEFVKKLISLESALNFNEIFDAVKEFVQTDATLNDALFLLNEVKDIDLSHVYSHTLPGEDAWIGGGYYYNPPEISELREFVKEQIAVDLQPESEIIKDPIVILNGNGKSKMASKFKTKLEEAGYNISSIGDYSGDRKLKTRIYVKKQADGQDLQQYFNLSEIIVDEDIENITIVLGQIEE